MKNSPRAGRRGFAFFGALWLALAAGAAANYREDALLRRDVERFQSRFTLDRRRPLESASVRLAPSGDWACAIAAESVLADVAGGVRLSTMDPEARRLWLRAIIAKEEEIDGAVELELRAIRARPGWGYHDFLLGQLAYAGETRSPTLSPDPSRFDRWRTPLRAAASLDGGDDGIWGFLAAAYLRNWGALPPGARSEARPLFRRAMLDARFVARALPLVADALGLPAARELLADRPDVLRAAIGASEPFRDAEETAELERRWESAERAARALDLAHARARFRIGDEEGLRAACAAWTRNHPVLDFDDPAARAQAAAILGMWPREPGGSWREDPRAVLVRYFLDGREGSIDGRALDRSVDALEGVPEPVRARAKLLGGDPEGAERIFSSSPTIGSFEWTKFLAESARRHLREGRIEEARRALSRIAPAARDECDVLLVRRDVEDALPEGPAAGVAAADLGRARRERFPAAEWSARGTLPLCLDPRWTARRLLEVEIESPGPAIVAWGWDEARSGSARASGSARFRIPLAGLAGLRTFWIRAVYGGPVAASATIVPADPPVAGRPPAGERSFRPDGPIASGDGPAAPAP